jgi:Tfp pilus assembly protein PilF
VRLGCGQSWPFGGLVVFGLAVLGVACQPAARNTAGRPPAYPGGGSGSPVAGPSEVGGALTGRSGGGATRPSMNQRAAAAYRVGQQRWREGALDAAARAFSDAVAADASAYLAHQALGTVRERLGDRVGAMAAYAEAIRVVRDYAPAINATALLLARRGSVAEAEEYLNQQLVRLERSPGLLTTLAELKSLGGDSGAAQRLAREALELDSDYRPAMLVLARDHYRARRLELALYALQGILDGYGAENPPRDRDNPEARMLRGLILKERGQRGAALRELKRAVELRPDLTEAGFQLAGYYLEAGNAVEAVPLLEQVLRYDPNHLLAREQLGEAYRLVGREEEGRRQLEWVVSVSPNMYEARYALGLLYLFSTRLAGMTPEQALDRALAELEETRRLRPRARPGQSDDVDELIAAAKSKKASLEAMLAEQSAASTNMSPATESAAPALSQPPATPESAAGAGASAPAAAGSIGNLDALEPGGP